MSVFVVSDDRMLLHKCEWDEHHIENPERLVSVLDQVKKLDNEEIVWLDGDYASKEDLLLVHTEEYLELLESTTEMSLKEHEELSTHYDSVYFNQYTYNAALLSAGCALIATKQVLETSSSGFALIRPPGHHATPTAPCGFCFLNNIAICAKYASKQGKKVLIVDWDVHAAQGTQYCIRDDKNIQLISIHRYENGNFWPNLAESGVHHEYSNTLNVPLDRVGYGDKEYISIMQGVILPFIHKFKPDLILVSAGYDAALGDLKGEMEITPNGFEYLTGMLSAQEIPMVCLLEGGYFLPVVTESTISTLKGLVNKTTPSYNFGYSKLLPPTIEVLKLKNLFHCDAFESFNLIRQLKGLPELTTSTQSEFICQYVFEPPCPTRNLYPPRPVEEDDYFNKLLLNKKDISVVTDTFNVATTHISVIIDCESESFVLPLQTSADIAFIYFHLLLPVSFQYKLNVDENEFSYKFDNFFGHYTHLTHKEGVINEDLAKVIASLPTELFS